MTKPMTRAAAVLVALFNEDAPEDETPEVIVEAVIGRLLENGFVIAPVEPTKAMNRAIRQAIYDRRSGGDAGNPGGPARVWRAAMEELTDHEPAAVCRGAVTEVNRCR